MNNDKIIFDLNIGAYMSLINKYLLNNNLGKEDIVLNCIEKLKIKIPEAINTKNYLEKGPFPIIDQGKKFIGGYSNDGKNLFDIGNPVIIFGDHTRNLKYIDFPFILGADGVKVIKPKSEFIEKYFYYSLYSINIESKGYNRHYKYLMNGTIVIPNFKDSVLFQNKVLAFLETLEKGDNIAKIFFDKETENQILNLHNKIKEIHLNLIPIGNKNLSYIKQLKQAILQEAIEGKLTSSWREKNTGIEPAQILLEKIKKEKEELVKQKKLKKQEKLKEISQDEISFKIPENWSWCRLGNVAKHITDGTHNTPNYIEKGISFLSVKDIAHGFINFSNTKFISEDEHKELYKRCNPEFEDILLTKVGTTGIAKVIDVKKDFSIFVSVALIKNFGEYIFPYYLENLINSPLVKQYSEEGTTGVGNKNLVLNKIKDFIIPLPPLEEQKEIVKKVDELMKLCDELEKQSLETKENSENLMKSVLSEVFSR